MGESDSWRQYAFEFKQLLYVEFAEQHKRRNHHSDLHLINSFPICPRVAIQQRVIQDIFGQVSDFREIKRQQPRLITLRHKLNVLSQLVPKEENLRPLIQTPLNQIKELLHQNKNLETKNPTSDHSLLLAHNPQPDLVLHPTAQPSSP